MANRGPVQKIVLSAYNRNDTAPTRCESESASGLFPDRTGFAFLTAPPAKFFIMVGTSSHNKFLSNEPRAGRLPGLSVETASPRQCDHDG
jgi:hypothetical protein